MVPSYLKCLFRSEAKRCTISIYFVTDTSFPDKDRLKVINENHQKLFPAKKDSLSQLQKLVPAIRKKPIRKIKLPQKFTRYVTRIFTFSGEKCAETQIKYIFWYTNCSINISLCHRNRMIFSKKKQTTIIF